MRKSSSVQIMKIPFNPKEFKIGQSRIDFIPKKLEIRRNSASNCRTVAISQSYQLQLIRRQNNLLRHQNEQLRRENQEIKSKTSNFLTIKTQQKNDRYRDLISKRMESKTKNSRVTTECQTGFFSKQNSLDKSQLTIQQLYQTYGLSKQLPTLDDLYKISDKFFADYRWNYQQLKVFFNYLDGHKNAQKYIKLGQIINLYKIPLEYQKSPNALFRQISKSKDKPKINSLKQKKNQLCLEVLSPFETTDLFEKLLIKISKSDQMLRNLKGNLKGNHELQKFLIKILSTKN